jgi:hypothetical protein
LRAKIPAIMPHYRLFLYNQYNRVRYPGTFDLSNVDAARAIGLQVAPYWRDLSADQRGTSLLRLLTRYVPIVAADVF